MLKALAISRSSFGSPARIEASLLPRTFDIHSGSTTTARPIATRSAPIPIAPSASAQVLIPPLAITAVDAALMESRNQTNVQDVAQRYLKPSRRTMGWFVPLGGDGAV